MATTIRCGTCGKSYDYGKNELCPRCGAYTSPSDRQQQMLQAERKLLSERVGGRDGDCTPECMPMGYGSHQDRPRQSYGSGADRERESHGGSSAAATRTAMRREEVQMGYGSHQGRTRQSYGSGADRERESHGGSSAAATRTAMRREEAQPRYDGRREYTQETHGKTLGKITAVAIILALAALLLFVLPAALSPVLETQSALYGRTDSVAIHTHSPGDVIQTGDFSISVSSWGFVPPHPDLDVRLPQGKRLLCVAVSFPEVRNPGDVLPQVYLSSGDAYFPRLSNSSYWNLSGAVRELGYNEVSLEDARYYDLVVGYFLFPVDEELSSFTLCVESLERNLLGWAKVDGVHELPLDASIAKEVASL